MRPYGPGSLGYPRAEELDVERFSMDRYTFTPHLGKRPGNGPFDYAPILQGNRDSTGTPDIVTFPRGTLLGNQTQYFYSNFDPYQGSISFWITPEWAGNDGVDHWILSDTGNKIQIRKDASNNLLFLKDGQSMSVSAAAWTAGTTYHICLRWDSRNALDGTNFFCISVDGANTFGGTTAPTVTAPGATQAIGSQYFGASLLSANAIIEGLCISRVPFYDGTYGCPMWFDESGPIDVIAAIYAAGAGADPAQIFGSWDCTFFLPTNQSAGALVTGTGEAWSHPHGSEEIGVPFVDDGGLPGTDYCVIFNGSSTNITVSDNATIQDMQDNAFTVDVWALCDGPGTDSYVRLLDKYFWRIEWQSDNEIYAKVSCATSDATCRCMSSDSGLSRDGKWHLITFFFDDAGDRKPYIAIDGVWHTQTQVAGVGAITSDVGRDLVFGKYQGGEAFYYFDGSMAWIEISDNDRHSHGTDFILPRYPYIDGNTIECWLMDEGTGATAAAQVTSPANDGTITDGSWSAIWDVVGTPEIPRSVEFFRENDGIGFGNGANINDLPTADCTIEFYALIPPGAYDYTGFLTKTDNTSGLGWDFVGAGGGTVLVRVQHATDDFTVALNDMYDGRWHHYALDWTFATLTGRVFVDGELAGTDTAGGAYVADAANICIANGRNVVGSLDGNFTIGPIRLSDVRRYTGNSFIPPSRNNWPANDANAQLITRMNDGAGATVTDYSGNAYNGTITFGATTRWNNTPDLAIDEPGRMIYNQGYNYGSDGANDGIYIPVTLTASTDYVIRVPMRYSPRAWPRITLYDVTGAAAIVDFDAPPLTAVHDGGAGAAAFTSTGEVYPASLIGGTIYNVTDGSSGTITAVGGTNQDTITAALAGGGSNDWQVGEQAYIIPAQAGWVFNEPIVARTSANTDYEVRITNRNSDGVITVHQAEVLESLLINGDHESLNGGFPGAAELITGWTNSGLDAGDTQPEAAIIHSGAQSLNWAAAAADSEYMYYVTNQATGAFQSVGGWVNGNGRLWGYRQALHSNIGDPNVRGSAGGGWEHIGAVWRVTGVASNFAVRGDNVAYYSDDIYMFLCDDITLTVTPASEANSLEEGGIRVDGDDRLEWQLETLQEHGVVEWRAIPRFSAAVRASMGAGGWIDIPIDGQNYLYFRWLDTGDIRCSYEANNVLAITNTWTPTWAAGDDVLFRLEYGSFGVRVYVDNRLRLVAEGAPTFAAPPTLMFTGRYWGLSAPCDMVIKEP